MNSNKNIKKDSPFDKYTSQFEFVTAIASITDVYRRSLEKNAWPRKKRNNNFEKNESDDFEKNVFA